MINIQFVVKVTLTLWSDFLFDRKFDKKYTYCVIVKNLKEYYDIIEGYIFKNITEKTTDKSKEKKLPKLQTRLSSSKKKTNELQRVQKKVRR